MQTIPFALRYLNLKLISIFVSFVFKATKQSQFLQGIMKSAYDLIHFIFNNSCGKAAKREGYRYFCIEYYGECWGYKEFDVTQPHAGATKCWGKRPNYETCIHDQKNPICVGKNDHGYIYEVN